MERILVLVLLLALVTGAGAQTPLTWKDSNGFRIAEVRPEVGGKPGFTQMKPEATGVSFTNHLADLSAARNQIRMIGSGVALGDVDGDGWCDIYFCRLEGPNVLYRNLGGWKFEEITAKAGVACPDQYSTGAVLADVDGDGDLDLLVNAIGRGTRLFRNQGHGTFQEAPDAGLLDRYCGTSLALADVDGDGDLDLYAAAYRTNTIRSTGIDVLNIGGQRVLRPEDREQYEITPQGFLLEHGEVDVLYRNDGQGRFSPVAWNQGTFLDVQGQKLAAGPKDWSLSVMFRDLNQDGHPDLYVCNDFWSPDQIWTNDSTGRFRALSNLAVRHTSTFSMGVDFADINRDGDDDFVVLDMLSRDHSRRMRQQFMTGSEPPQVGTFEDRPQIERNTLFLNRGDGTYAEIAQLSGLHASEWSWCPVFLDVDLDGYEDLLVTTGHDFDTQDADTDERIASMGPAPQGRAWERLLLSPRLFLPNFAFRNRGDLTFEEMGAAWGFHETGVSHGMAVADLDLDGDLDVVVNNLNLAAGLFRNNHSAPRVAVRLRGRAPNTQAIGAKIRLRNGPVPVQQQEVLSGGRYLSGDDPIRVFAAGANTQALVLDIVWRGGGCSRLEGVQPNHYYEIHESTLASSPCDPPRSTPPVPEPLFRDMSELLSHRHHELPFDDLQRQPLLPRRLSQSGPGVAWFDWDQDGWEDLIVGCGRDGVPALFRNEANGGFARREFSSVPFRFKDDVTTILGVHWGPRQMQLLVGQSCVETADASLAGVIQFEAWAGGWSRREALPAPDGDIGPICVADVDGDGDLDLFVGGRSAPGRYPEPATSRLYRNHGGAFQPSQEWKALGIVNGAVFTDLNGDGFADLALACEWGPVRVLRNERGHFTEATGQLGLMEYTGWWNGVAAGDFDDDGRIDLVASNWGWNTPYQECFPKGVRIYYGDLSQRGFVDGLEGYQEPGSNRDVPRLRSDRVTQVLPWVRDRFPTATAYSSAGIAEILGDRKPAASQAEVRWLASTVFLNRGDKFEARPLPVTAQFSPVFSVVVADVDADGHQDLFLSQNFFAVEAQVSRYDAGWGLVLLGDGKGGFRALSSEESGVRLVGEQRGAAVCDYDADGRVDLVVGQNGGRTALLRNRGKLSGLRVVLRGSASNPLAIGAVVRGISRQGPGPAIEIHGGGGYWSQDSSVAVLGGIAKIESVEVRWPGGGTLETKVPAQARVVTVAHP